MFDTDSYKSIPIDMKTKEINDYHWMSNTKADIKTFGYGYAAKKLHIDEHTSDSDVTAIKLKGEFNINNKEFMDYYMKK